MWALVLQHSDMESDVFVSLQMNNMGCDVIEWWLCNSLECCYQWQKLAVISERSATTRAETGHFSTLKMAYNMSCVEYIWRYLWLSPPHGQGDQTDRCLQHDSYTQIICIAEHTPRNLEAGGRGFKSCRVLGFFLLLLSLLSVSSFNLFLLSLIRSFKVVHL